MEIWKPVKDYEGLYEVSSFGRIKSLGNDKTRKEKILKQNINGNGYFKVCLFKDGISQSISFHQLVAMAFLNHMPCGYKLVVDHINGDKLDNRLENLQVVSQRANVSKSNKLKTSKYIGVSWCKSAKKWTTKIQINSKKKHLGYFTNEEEAHLAYQNKLKELIW
jgi:hypothetical protein